MVSVWQPTIPGESLERNRTNAACPFNVVIRNQFVGIRTARVMMNGRKPADDMRNPTVATENVQLESTRSEERRHSWFRWKWCVFAGSVLVGLVLVYRFVLLDYDTASQPVCHKQILTAIHVWQDRQRTKEYPNVNGRSAESLAKLDEFMGDEQVTEKYHYVPGLRQDDAGDLVMLYMKQPTRWMWHAEPQTIFREKEWIVVPIDFCLFGRQEMRDGELNERMSFEELRRRVRKTLDFLRKNKRPHWKTVVKEHTAFLAEAAKQ